MPLRLLMQRLQHALHAFTDTVANDEQQESPETQVPGHGINELALGQGLIREDPGHEGVQRLTVAQR